ncbi:SDR family NAD(P)-dependent oxidoreductase, partial [bacterium]|nr:SDR family NAD(P)-dependent oxidoreductase [bacterium]
MNTNAIHPILVTGASTGIGNHLSKHLAEQGHLVYGTVRKDEDFKKLQTIENLIPIKLDVRDPQQIQEGLKLITEAGHGLYALVN